MFTQFACGEGQRVKISWMVIGTGAEFSQSTAGVSVYIIISVTRRSDVVYSVHSYKSQDDDVCFP